MNKMHSSDYCISEAKCGLVSNQTSLEAGELQMVVTQDSSILFGELATQRTTNIAPSSKMENLNQKIVTIINGLFVQVRINKGPSI